MQVVANRSPVAQGFKAAIRYIPLFIALTLFCNQTVLAKNSNYRHNKSFKYAKEDFKPQPRFWGSLEYMNMWQQDGPVSIPLVTRNNNPLAVGSLGETGTRIIYGSGSGDDLNYENISGGRVTIGGWIDPYNRYGLEFSGFLLAKVFTNFEASSPGGDFPILSIPYLETSPTAGEAAVSAKSPTLSNNPNNVSVNTGSQMWGSELNFVYNLSQVVNYPLVALIGFRYVSLDESLALNDTIFDTTTSTSQTPASMGVLSWNDSFQTANNFYGLSLGLRSNLVASNGFTLDLIGKVALGDNAESITIDGYTVSTNDAMGVPTGTINAGIFAQPSNIGSYSQNTFAVLPELEVKVGYMVAEGVHPYIGYNVMYLNKVVRPGNQMDRNINTTENPAFSGATSVTGALSPTAPGFNNNSYWIQGVTAGIEISL